jgi:UDP-glucuronate decarboxylase
MKMTSSTFLDSDIAQIVAGLGGAEQGFSGKTLLLAGAGGFLGRYFTAVFRHLNEKVLSKPCRVIALDNFVTGSEQPGRPDDDHSIRIIRHDVTQPLDLDEAVDFVVQAAGIASPFYYRAFPLETLSVATTGTRNLLEVATKWRARFTFFSSSEIYGDPDPRHVPTPESYRGNVACLGPRACYDESKRLGETLCYIYHERFGTATNQVRPFNVYGPGMQQSDYRVLPNFAGQIKAGRPLNVYGTGLQTRTFCYVTDAMVGFLLTILKGVPGEAYNIGNPVPEVSMLDLVKEIEALLGRTLAHRVIEYPDSYPADEPNRRCPDITKARMQLGFDPVVTLPDGLKRFLDWSDRAYPAQT